MPSDERRRQILVRQLDTPKFDGDLQHRSEVVVRSVVHDEEIGNPTTDADAYQRLCRPADGMRFGATDNVVASKTSVFACISNVAKPSQFGTGRR